MTPTLQGSVNALASVYFDGKCISHTVTLADGARKSVGVILPSTLTFNTDAPEVMETVSGHASILLAGATEWVTYGPGQSFDVPGNASFQIKVEGEPYHYICHFG